VPSDLELLDRWRAGEVAAGDELFQLHFVALYRFFRHKTSGDVDDLVQRTFLAIAEARARFRDGSSFRSYLFRCARNVLHDHFRRVYRGGGELDAGLTSVHDLDPSPSAALAEQQDKRLLLTALRRIPIDEQIAIELFYWEALSGPEIAEVLGIPEGTVRTRLRAARLRLAGQMAELRVDPAVIESTLGGLDRWAEAMRERIA
jgi:RNA polymerase sigma-70 factor (ECF subfamily)